MAIPALYPTLTCALLLFLLLPTGRLTPPLRWAALAACAAASLPFDHALTPASVVRGALGDLSVITVCWLGVAAAGRLLGQQPLLPERERLAAACSLLAGAVLLYPATLGITDWDPYRLGFGPLLPAACLLVVLLLAGLGFAFISTAIALALAACALRALESNNLWDYLLDPCLGVYAAALVLSKARSRYRRTAPSAAPGTQAAAKAAAIR